MATSRGQGCCFFFKLRTAKVKKLCCILLVFQVNFFPTLRFLNLMKIHYKHEAFRLFQNHWRPQLLISCLLVCSLIRCRRRRRDWRPSLHFKEDFVREGKQKISIVAHSLLSSKYNSYGWTVKKLIVIRQKHTFSAIAVDCCTALELSQLVMRHNRLRELF